MRAVRLAGPRRLEVVDLPDPPPAEDEVVLRVSAAGICGSDLSCYKTGVFSSSVLGHEFSGVVESIGAGVAGFAPGDSVLVDPKIPCGTCPDCLAGAAYRCAAALTLGPGGTRNGGFAELVVVPERCLYPLPLGLSLEDGCLAEPLAVAIHGIERGGFVAGEDAVVVGLGPIGLLGVAALRARGAGAITGIDPVEVRRSLASDLGAGRTLPSMAGAPDGVPLVLECSGRPEVLQDATNIAAGGGRVVLLGVPVAEASVIPLVWVTREITVIGSIASSPADFLTASALLAAEPGIARIITRRVPLGEIPAVFEELVASPADGKVVVSPTLPG